jgi:hypothetical protein
MVDEIDCDACGVPRLPAEILQSIDANRLSPVRRELHSLGTLA